jgi:MFS family permease
MPAKTKLIIRKIYVYKALVDFILLYPLYNLMFAAHGLSAFRISTLLIIWATTDLVANVPTGVLADRLSRRKLLVASPLIEATGFAVWWAWPTYGGFAMGFVLWGIGGAIFDGTYEALLFDELKSVDSERQYVKIAGRAQSLSLIANFSATLLASAAILLGYNFVIGASIGALLTAAGVAMTFPETKRYEEVAETRYLHLLRQGIREALHNRILLEIILLGGFVGAIYGSLEEYVPLFLKQAGYHTALVPLFVAFTVLAAAAASFAAHRFEALRTITFMLLLALAGFALVAASKLLGISSVLLLASYTFLIKLIGTVYDGKVQHSITGKLRATVTSVSLFVVEIMSIAIYLAYGLLSRHGGNFTAFKFAGFATLLFAACYTILSPKLLSKKSLEAV